MTTLVRARASSFIWGSKERSRGHKLKVTSGRGTGEWRRRRSTVASPRVLDRSAGVTASQVP